MKKLRISVVDFGLGYGLADRLLDWVVDRYAVTFVPRDADYVLHSCNGYDVLCHPGVRIFVTGENVEPDFNLSDYAFGFSRMEFGDRYCRLPLYRLYTPVYERMLRPHPATPDQLRAKTGFCAFVASSPADVPERQKIVELLSAYKRVDLGGRWMNNVGGPVPNKYAFQSRYKFAIACENSSTAGYVTEKIADAFASGAVPIYWGDPEIARDFNPDAFVNCHAFQSLEEVAAHVRELDCDDARYLRMLSAPCFRDGREPEWLREEKLRAFLANIFDQPLAQAYRRNRGRWGRKHEQTLTNAFHRPLIQIERWLRSYRRRRRQARNPYVWQPIAAEVTADTLLQCGSPQNCFRASAKQAQQVDER